MAKRSRGGLGAEQWAVLGFSAIGLYAVYRLVKGSGEPDPRIDLESRQPIASRVPTLAVNIVRPDGNAQLKTGTPYRGRFELHPAGAAFPPKVPTRPFEHFTTRATREQLVSELQRAGFANVTVSMNVAEATPTIPLPMALEGAGTGSRWFTGTWMGPTATHDLGNIVLLWPTASG